MSYRFRALAALAVSPIVPRCLTRPLMRLAGVHIPDSSYIGRGVFVGSPNVRFGSNVGVNNETFLDGFGPLRIEHNVRIGPRCTIITGTHSIRASVYRRDLEEPTIPVEVSIGRGAWLCANVTVIGPAHIGEGCVIAAGAVVIGDTEPNGLYVGNPARRVRELPTSSEGLCDDDCIPRRSARG